DPELALLSAPEGWNLEQVRQVLVPVGGRRDQSHLRARLLGSLSRRYALEVTYLAILDPSEARPEVRLREAGELAEDEAAGRYRLETVRSADVAGTLVEAARSVDLVVLGLRREGRRGKVLGEVPLRVAREAGKAVLMIGQR
ncbi:MAG: universal stress protein, partial [Holophagales bacterium]|nr:universal stress protein [Holophagales bacterium]